MTSFFVVLSAGLSVVSAIVCAKETAVPIRLYAASNTARFFPDAIIDFMGLGFVWGLFGVSGPFSTRYARCLRTKLIVIYNGMNEAPVMPETMPAMLLL